MKPMIFVWYCPNGKWHRSMFTHESEMTAWEHVLSHHRVGVPAYFNYTFRRGR